MNQDDTPGDKPVHEQEGSTSDKGVVLSHDDILSADSISLAHIDAIPGGAEDSVASTLSGAFAQASLQLQELLSGTGPAASAEGGFLTFDSDSSPGNTIVRVVFEGMDTQEVVEVGTFKGGGMDLNSLLGLLGSDDTHHRG